MSQFAKFFYDNAASLWRDWKPSPDIPRLDSCAEFIKYARECFEEMECMNIPAIQMDMFGNDCARQN